MSVPTAIAEVLDRISAVTRLPLVVGGMPQSMCDPAYLASRRARLWNSGHQTVNVAIQALYEAMGTVHAGTLASSLSGTASKDTMSMVTAADAYDAQVRVFLA